MGVDWDHLAQPHPGSIKSYGRAFRARQPAMPVGSDEKMAALMTQLFDIPWDRKRIPNDPASPGK